MNSFPSLKARCFLAFFIKDNSSCISCYRHGLPKGFYSGKNIEALEGERLRFIVPFRKSSGFMDYTRVSEIIRKKRKLLHTLGIHIT